MEREESGSSCGVSLASCSRTRLVSVFALELVSSPLSLSFASFSLVVIVSYCMCFFVQICATQECLLEYVCLYFRERLRKPTPLPLLARPTNRNIYHI